jgi:hypothetical protein
VPSEGYLVRTDLVRIGADASARGRVVSPAAFCLTRLPGRTPLRSGRAVTLVDENMKNESKTGTCRQVREPLA